MSLQIGEFDGKDAQAQRRFVVNLQVRDDQAPQVRSCEVMSDTYRNRTTFQGSCALDDVFEERVADGLRHCLDALSVKTEVVSLPDFFIETPGLILAGAHVMSSIAPDGMVAIILRFQLMIGGVACAFKSDIGVEQPLIDQRERLATLVLADISLPLLDICAAADADLMHDSPSMHNFTRKLAERSREIRFQIELVKRYLDAMDRYDFTDLTRELPNALTTELISAD